MSLLTWPPVIEDIVSLCPSTIKKMICEKWSFKVKYENQRYIKEMNGNM